MHTRVCWEARHQPGFEHCAVAVDGGLRADGVVLGVADERNESAARREAKRTDGVADEGPFRLRYRVETDDRFRTRRVVVDPLTPASDAERPATTRDSAYRLTADGEGSWTVDDAAASDLEGCLDVDVAVTPLTNTLPVRRLELGVEESATVDVVYLDPLADEIAATRQRYTNLGADDAGRRYRYEGLESGFSAEVVVDERGLVVDYPGLFERVE